MSSLKEQNDALTQSYDNREHDMQMDWFIRGGAMVRAASCSASCCPFCRAVARAASAG